MPKLEPRPVPEETNEITYTGKRGEQVSIRVSHGKRHLAHPQSAAEVKILDRLYPTVAPEAGDATPDEPSADTVTPDAGAQEA